MKKFSISLAKTSNLLLLAFSLPLSVLAITSGPIAQPPSAPVQTLGDVTGVICTLFNWMFIILIVVATVFAVLAGYKYLTAGGDAEKIKTANHQLIYVAIAIVIALVARGVPMIITNFLGVSGGFSC